MDPSRAPRRNKYIRLSEAYRYFAPRRLKEMYRELGELPAPKLPDQGSTNLTEGLQALSAHVSHSWRTEPAEREMRKHVAEELRCGHLEARGLKTHPEIGEALEAIPPYYFDHARMDWRKNTVEKFGRRYEAVEVRRSETESEDQIQQSVVQHVSAGDRRGRSRPSKKEAIMAAIAALVREGTDLSACKPIVACQLIRERARDTGHDVTKGFSDPVITSYLSRYLDQNRRPDFPKF